jgi:hypothetical protein
VKKAMKQTEKNIFRLTPDQCMQAVTYADNAIATLPFYDQQTPCYNGNDRLNRIRARAGEIVMRDHFGAEDLAVSDPTGKIDCKWHGWMTQIKTTKAGESLKENVRKCDAAASVQLYVLLWADVREVHEGYWKGCVSYCGWVTRHELRQCPVKEVFSPFYELDYRYLTNFEEPVHVPASRFCEAIQ